MKMIIYYSFFLSALIGCFAKNEMGNTEGELPQLFLFCDNDSNGNCQLYLNQLANQDTVLYNQDTFRIQGGIIEKKDVYEIKIKFEPYLHSVIDIDSLNEKLLYLNTPDYQFIIMINERFDTAGIFGEVTYDDLENPDYDFYKNKIVWDNIIPLSSSDLEKEEVISLFEMVRGYKE